MCVFIHIYVDIRGLQELISETRQEVKIQILPERQFKLRPESGTAESETKCKNLGPGPARPFSTPIST